MRSLTIEVTGDLGILDETVAYLDGPELHAGELESFFQPTVSEQRGTIFEHCARGLDQRPIHRARATLQALSRDFSNCVCDAR
jgi:cellobiose phosphorylase